MKYFPLIWAALRRKPLRTFLTLLSVTTAFTLFGLMMGLSASYQRIIDAAQQDLVTVGSRFGPSLPDGMRAQIMRHPNVAEIGRYGFIPGYYQIIKNPVFILMADARAPHALGAIPLTPQQLARFSQTRNGLYFSRKAAEKWHKKPGDSFTVSGIPRGDGSTAWNFQLLDVVNDTSAYPIGFIVGDYDFYDKSLPLANQGKPAWFQVAVKDAARADETARAIDLMFANSPNPTQSQSDVTGARSNAQAAINVGAVTQRVAAVGLFMILLLTGNGIAQSVRERISEFAVLKTLGYPDSEVMLLVFAEAAVPCFVGAALGLAAAAALSSQFVHIIPPNRGIPAPYMAPAVFAEAAVSATLVVFLGAVLPALRIRRLRVADALAGR